MKSNKIKVFAIVVIIVSVSILIWVTVARTSMLAPPSAEELENFFGDASCSWPCWQGITPSITSSVDALQRLNDSSLVLKDSIQSEESRTGFGKTNWNWEISDNQRTLGGNMEWRDGMVREIGLTAYPIIISIGEAINRFGPPEKISVIDCSEIMEGEHRYWCGTLYYVKSGFEIHVEWEGSWSENDVQIMPSDPIGFVVLYEPSTIEERFSSLGLDPQNRDLRDWKGYGNLYELYVR